MNLFLHLVRSLTRDFSPSTRSWRDNLFLMDENEIINTFYFFVLRSQVLGKVPTISIDKTDGCQMYLSTDSMDVEIISSKSSEMNVMVPKPNGDYVRFSLYYNYIVARFRYVLIYLYFLFFYVFSGRVSCAGAIQDNY